MKLAKVVLKMKPVSLTGRKTDIFIIIIQFKTYA